MDYEQYFREKITTVKAKNLYREPKSLVKNSTKKLLNFCSNDYLNLCDNKAVKASAIKAVQKFGVGAKASRYVFEGNSYAQKLEKRLAKLKNCDAGMVLGSGYLSGIGAIPALVGAHDLIIADKLIHSSLLDGCKLSGAKLMRFRHNDLKHAEEILKQIASNEILRDTQDDSRRLIITETVFSMDGDLGKIDELLALAKKYKCLILTDDAHGLGIIKQKYAKYDFHLQCGTFSKAVGGYGGYICGSNLMIEYLRNFTRPAIYSTALSPAVLAANLKAVEIISKDKTLGKKALQNAHYFCDLVGLKKSESTIVPVIIGDAVKTLEVSEKLKKDGFLISAIRPPTVEVGKSRLRITFCSNHKKSDIKKLAGLILKYCI